MTAVLIIPLAFSNAGEGTWLAISALTCWYIAYKDIRVSSLITLAFEGISVALILALAAVVLFKHGIAIDTAQLKLKGVGLHGMSLAVVACIFSLVGFENATALGSEAKNPLRNAPRAGIWSLILTGAFMVIMGYVEVFCTRHYGTPLGSITAPLSVLSSLSRSTCMSSAVPVADAALADPDAATASA